MCVEGYPIEISKVTMKKLKIIDDSEDEEVNRNEYSMSICVDLVPLKQCDEGGSMRYKLMFNDKQIDLLSSIEIPTKILGVTIAKPDSDSNNEVFHEHYIKVLEILPNFHSFTNSRLIINTCLDSPSKSLTLLLSYLISMRSLYFKDLSESIASNFNQLLLLISYSLFSGSN